MVAARVATMLLKTTFRSAAHRRPGQLRLVRPAAIAQAEEERRADAVDVTFEDGRRYSIRPPSTISRAMPQALPGRVDRPASRAATRSCSW